MKQLHTFIEWGDATLELKKLYSEGWNLITVVTLYAISIPESEKHNNNHFFAYAIQYFLEKNH